MSGHFIFMIIGDFLTIIMMGFYAGVGIWESGTPRHILGMLVPIMAVWLIAALIFKIYKDLPKSLGAAKFSELSKFTDELIEAQKPRQTLFVWLITAAFLTFWLRFYWTVIIRSQSYFYGFSIGSVIWFFGSYATFFLLWRCFWMILMVLLALARSYRWVRIVEWSYQP